MENKSIGSFLASLRKAHGMTQQELADILKVSNKTVSKWERDESYPDITLIPVIAELFNVTADEILRGERKESDGIKDVRPEEKTNKIALDLDKHFERMLAKSLARFRNLAYIALALPLMGLIALFTVSFAFYRPVLAFGIHMVFILASILLMAISMNNIGSALKDNEIVTGRKELVDPAIKERNRYAYACYIADAIVFIISLPLILTGDKVFLHSVISVSNYITMFVKVLPAVFIFIWLVYKFVVVFKISPKRYSHKGVRQMDVIQAATAICCYVAASLTRGGKLGQGTGYLNLLVIIFMFTAIIIIGVIYVIKSGNMLEKLMITLACCRNFLCVYLGLYIIFAILDNSPRTKFLAIVIMSRDTGLQLVLWATAIIIVLYELCRGNYIKLSKPDKSI